jgi:hypothetical protein
MTARRETYHRDMLIGHDEDGRPIIVTVSIHDRPGDLPGDCLSISGQVGQGIGCVAAGQMLDYLSADLARPIIAPADLAALRAIWGRWHLNDLRAGCAHQRAEGWRERPIDPTKPTRAYGRHCPGQRGDSWNMLTWVTRAEHPEGLLSHPCPVCGYKYGSAWLYEELPADVRATLVAIGARLPELAPR